MSNASENMVAKLKLYRIDTANMRLFVNDETIKIISNSEHKQKQQLDELPIRYGKGQDAKGNRASAIRQSLRWSPRAYNPRSRIRSP